MHYRCALKWVINSFAHPILDNILVSRYISGLFNLFPAPPKLLKDIWDVNDVLLYWDRLPMSEDLPLMLLSQKTVILILISSMRRRGELLHMNIDNIVYAPNSMTFLLDTYPKTYCLLNRQEQLHFVTVRKFPENRNICPMYTLQMYLKRTSVLRMPSTKKLFITTQHPFRPVARMTLRCWILTCLSDAGINIHKYAAKTTRHAASLKAFFAGVSIDTVMLRAGWKNPSSFVIHYNLPVVCKERAKHEAATYPVQSPIAIAKLSKSRLSISNAFKTSKNVHARKLLESAKKDRFKKAVAFQSLPYASPPPRVQRVLLDKPVHVEIPASKFTKTPPYVARRKKPYVTYTSSGSASI